MKPMRELKNRLLVISPVKDESQYIERTIRSMVAQTCRPTLWLIVDDGSSDRTGELAEEAAKQHDWIKVLRRTKGTARRVGPGVIEAFYAGLELVDINDYDYVAKFDGDLEFEPNYFADCLTQFDENPRLGTMSGKVFIPEDGRLIPERNSDEFSMGCSKLYRRECFQEIGGFVREVMWDGIDCHRCRLFGWEAKSDPDPRLNILHLRPMGSSQKNIYHGRMRWGRGQYFMGTSFLYIFGIATYRMRDRPVIIGGICIFLGYMQAWIQKAPQYNDLEFRTFLRRWQMNELSRRFLGFFGLGKKRQLRPQPILYKHV
jgi:glycosyltransferase involved in cell wall biosynthesis